MTFNYQNMELTYLKVSFFYEIDAFRFFTFSIEDVSSTKSLLLKIEAHLIEDCATDVLAYSKLEQKVNHFLKGLLYLREIDSLEVILA